MPTDPADRPRPATAATSALHERQRAELPAADTTDFDDARRGFVAPLPDGGVITDDAGRVVWDLSRFGFVRDGEAPATVHPSLWRQTQLLTEGGLFEVTEGVYQVRSADLSNIDMIEGETGIIVVDPLISTETARAALELYYAHRGRRPVVAVIYTHSHIDHYGGVLGVVDVADVRAGRVRVVAPEGFTEAALSENLIAGTAMTRRATYMYGALLPTGPQGAVSPGLGLAISLGRHGFVEPTDVITEPVQELVLDGVRFVFMLAPDTEAPAEMLFHLPDRQALCSAEDATHTLHNLYTLRGARTRDAKAWSYYLDRAIEFFGDRTDVVFAQHHWPTWGRERALDFLRAQRDAYQFLHDQTLRLANHGHTMLEVAEELDFPPSLGQRWCNRGYYGSVSHNVKAVYNLYLGYFDANPATLHQLPPVAASERYVEYMGGAEAVLERARVSFDDGDYRWVAQVVNHVVFADPTNQEARRLQADALEQLGYQTENGVWRNFYLTGAQELRHGLLEVPAPDPLGPDTVALVPLELLLDYLGVRLDGPAADGVELTVGVHL
ncbi:MAG TPA: alkyl sulfatase dimerization domain-containing protein, partial [Acidimicrobiales bacterium]|nr:alkyl sulfatase dimerization domain-containing protein [Acidimicrobiales bacterium]